MARYYVSSLGGGVVTGVSREKWTSKRGFVLAAVGSAVGLGNMWRFSYLAAEHGGAAFVVLYLCFTVVIGLPVLLAELALGRGSGLSPVRALEYFGGRAWRPLGWLFVASGFLILAYYGVIAGWTVRYALQGLAGFVEDSGTYFEAVATGRGAIAWHFIFMAVTVLVVMRGVRGGIERVSTVLMPALFVLLVVLAAYALSLEAGREGYTHYLKPDFSQILDREVMAQAAGQAFFSLSLGMGAMLTFASYLDDEHNLPGESLIIGLSDFGVAFVAGLVVFPVLFAFGLQSQVSGSTVGALFITLPRAFAEMGFAGTVVGTLFFSGLVVGALTSAVSLLEVVVATAMDSLGWSRRRAAVTLGTLIALLGVPAALDLDVLGLMDQVAGNVFLVMGGLALSILVGWVIPDPAAQVRPGAGTVPWLGFWRGLLRYVVPPVLLFVLFGSLESTWDAIREMAGN